MTAMHEPTWRGPKSRPQWRASLETYACPTMGKLPVSEITPSHPGSRSGVAPVGEPGDLPGVLGEERQWLGIGHPFELGVGVPFRLLLNDGYPFTLGVRFGFDDADGLPVAEEDVVGGASIGRVFAHCDARSRAEVDGIPVRYVPPRRPEAIINAVAGNLLGSLVRIVGHAVTSDSLFRGKGVRVRTLPDDRNNDHRGLAVQGSTASTPVLRNSRVFRGTTTNPRVAAAAARKASGR